jgi:RNA polymerase sigma factor (sigma-70 family)
MDPMRATTSPADVATVWRAEAPRVLGALVRFVGDVDTAEDLAQEALLRALSSWPAHGVPERPGAWLTTTAKRIAIDRARHRQMANRHHAARTTDVEPPAINDEALDVDVKDDVLRMMFVACHPVLPRESRVALTLRWVAGLSTAEVARAFLSNEPAVAQRLVRARRTLSEARVPFVVPNVVERRARLGSLLEVLYLVFNEGYAASTGDDRVRCGLCDEALRLARRLAALLDDDSGDVVDTHSGQNHDAEADVDIDELHGVIALFELQASRFAARTAHDGTPIPLDEQDRTLWDTTRMQRGFTALLRAEHEAARRQRALGPYALQAAIAACHARADTFAATDWQQIVALYDALVEVTGSPVVALNRAVAVSYADGVNEALALVDSLADEPALQHYALLPAVRADLLQRLGHVDDAAAAFTMAATLSTNVVECRHFERRAAQCRAMTRFGPPA